MDTECKFISCNLGYEQFTGFSEAEVIGKTDLEIYANVPNLEIIQSFMEVNKKVISEGITITTEETHIRPGNVKILLKSTKTPLIQNGKIIGLLGISRDITEYRAAELAAQEASMAKTNFLAKMSHEIRTPMNAILGMAELALREKDIDNVHKHIFTVKHAGAHLLSIINDILDFSKIETGKLEIVPVNYSFSSLINDVISIISMRIIDSKLCFTVFIDCNIPDALSGDEARIRQVLFNILGNAVKYTETGFVSLIVNSETVDKNTVNLIMEVKDSGKGIKQEDITKLFNEYTQVDQEKNKGIEGTGLGLSIANGLVKAMDGKIDVNSEYGKGSTFTIKLPQQIRSCKALAIVDNPDKKSVIVYEHNKIYADSIFSAIENLGVYCTVVSTDGEFSEKLASMHYGFIFISLPLFMNNRDTISKFCANSKIVVLTEFGETIPDKNLYILTLPAYSISIANVLNGVLNSFSYTESNELIVRFTAPDAKILIIDDIITNLKVAKGLLMPYQMQIDMSKSGIEAIEATKINRYDLILMDHMMPEMDGIETAHRIRALESEDSYFKNVPIIALTANAVTGVKEMFMENGFNDFLSKPIDTVMLNAILEKWIPKEKRNILSTEKGAHFETKFSAHNTDY